MSDFYLLDENKQPVRVEGDDQLSIIKRWAQGIEPLRQTALDRLDDDKVIVSTVFLGIDHSFHFAVKEYLEGKEILFGDGAPHVPVLWETMIFGGAHDMYQERYASHEAALAGHARALELAIRGLPQ